MAKKKSLEDLQKELAKKQEDIKIINRKIGQQKRYINTRIGEELLKGLEISRLKVKKAKQYGGVYCPRCGKQIMDNEIKKV